VSLKSPALMKPEFNRKNKLIKKVRAQLDPKGVRKDCSFNRNGQGRYLLHAHN